MQYLLHFVDANLIKMLDIGGAIFSFVATYYAIRAKIFAWPITIIAITINIFLFWKQGIYGDVGLQIIYVGLAFYGWWEWLYGGINHTELTVRSISFYDALILGGMTIAGTIGFAFCLKFYTNSQIPYWDAITTVLSLIAQWLACRKILENWIMWFVVDLLYAGLYVFKQIPAHALLQVVYLGMAVAGYINWKRKLDLGQ